MLLERKYIHGGDLLWASGLTGYIVLGTALEERDLVARFGTAYRNYAAEVPAFFPALRAASARGRGRRSQVSR